MEAIYRKMKAANPNYLVTAAIGGGKWQPPKYDLVNSKQYLDYINLMTYSMATGNSYYQNALYKSSKGATLTSCSIDESVKLYNSYGIENAKILVGIPFYLTVQTGSGGPGSKVGTGKSIWYNQLDTTYAVSDTMKEYFDEECGVPYRYDAVNQIFVSFDNEKSIKRKCEYINALGLAGIMYWQYGQDVDDQLSNAIGKYINAA
jgi:chitinase